VSRQGVAAFGRGAARFAGSYGAPIFASYAGDLVSSSAGSAESAVAGGGESSFRGLKAGGSALTGAAIGGSVGFSVGGPVGAAVGAVTVGLYSLVSSLRESEKEIRQVKINNALSEFGDKINTLAVNGSSVDLSTSDAARRQLTAYRQQTSTKNQDEATGFFSGFDADSFSALQQRSNVRTLGVSFPNSLRLSRNRRMPSAAPTWVATFRNCPAICRKVAMGSTRSF